MPESSVRAKVKDKTFMFYGKKSAGPKVKDKTFTFSNSVDIFCDFGIPAAMVATEKLL